LEPHAELKDHYGYVVDSPSHPETEHPDSDVERVRTGFIAVTPIHLDLTDRVHWDRFKDWPWETPP